MNNNNTKEKKLYELCSSKNCLSKMFYKAKIMDDYWLVCFNHRSKWRDSHSKDRKWIKNQREKKIAEMPEGWSKWFMEAVGETKIERELTTIINGLEEAERVNNY